MPAASIESPRRLRRREAARYLSVSYSSLSKNALPLPYTMVGGVALYDVVDLDAYLASRRRVPADRSKPARKAASILAGAVAA